MHDYVNFMTYEVGVYVIHPVYPYTSLKYFYWKKKLYYIEALVARLCDICSLVDPKNKQPNHTDPTTSK